MSGKRSKADTRVVSKRWNAEEVDHSIPLCDLLSQGARTTSCVLADVLNGPEGATSSLATRVESGQLVPICLLGGRTMGDAPMNVLMVLTSHDQLGDTGKRLGSGSKSLLPLITY